MLNPLMKDRHLAAIFVIAMLAGLGYAIVTPPDRVPDEFSHFFRAVAMAEGDFFPPVGYVSPGHHFPGGFWMFRHRIGKDDPNARYTLDDIRAASAEPLNRQQTAGIEFPAWYSPAPYAAQATVAFVGIQAGWRPFWIFYLGRVANLLLCLAIIFAGMLALPHRAAIAGAVLLLPMTLSELAAWSADGMTIAVAILLTCLIVRNLEAEGVVATRELIALASVAFLLGLCKPAYFLLVLPVLFIPTARFGSVRRRIIATLAITLAIALGTLLAAASARAGQYNPRAHLPVDPAQQLRCVLDDPLRFAGVVARDLCQNGRFYLDEIIGRLGIMNVKLPTSLIVAEWLLLIWIGLSCGVRWKLPARLAAIVACVVTIAGINLAQYLVWSIICGDAIEGIQGRYFLPVLPLLLFSVALKPRDRAMSLVPVAVMGVVANGVAVVILVERYWR
jgi:uncharacterized membrane protein